MDNLNSGIRTELSDKELIFAESYLSCLNKAEGARQAGCPDKSAREQGYEIYNRVHVKAYIEEKLKERVLSAEEVVKIVSDTANSSLSDYYRPVSVIKREKIQVGLADMIKRSKEYISREQEYCNRVGLTEEAYDKFMENLNYERNSIVRMEIELERNPNAFRIIDSDPVLVEEMQLDINALVADKEKGKLKKVKYGKDGLEVEMYSALDAAEKLMKMHGKYEKDNSQKKPETPVLNVVITPPPKADE